MACSRPSGVPLVNEVLRQLHDVMLPVGLVAGVGYAFASWKRELDLRTLSQLLLYVFIPCLVLDGTTRVAEQATSLWRLPLAVLLLAAAQLCLAGLVVSGVARWCGRSLRGLMLPAALPNSGNMGLPICTLAFGEQAGLPLALVVFVSFSFVTFTAGVAIARGGPASLREPLRTPLLHALALGALLHATGHELPTAPAQAVHLLGQAAVPLMLFALGCQLRRVRGVGLGLGSLAAALRLLLGPLLAVAIIAAIDLDGLPAQVLLVQASMPSAVITGVLAENYQTNPDEVASAILVSTLLSVLTVPMTLAWVA